MRSTVAAGAGDARACAAEASAAVRVGLGGAAADVAFVFVSAEHAAEAEQVTAEVARELSPGVLVGASTEAVIGAGHEFEGRPAVSVLAASLGSGTARARHIAAGDAGSCSSSPGGRPSSSPTRTRSRSSGSSTT